MCPFLEKGKSPVVKEITLIELKKKNIILIFTVEHVE